MMIAQSFLKSNPRASCTERRTSHLRAHEQAARCGLAVNSL
jgi:hypothetical protein